MPSSVDEEHLHKLAVLNGLFQRLGILHAFCADASILPDELIPTPWISRGVYGYIVSTGSILRFNNDQCITKPEYDVWLSELHPWPKPARPSSCYVAIVTTRGATLQPASEQIPRTGPHQCPEHCGRQSIFTSIEFR